MVTFSTHMDSRSFSNEFNLLWVTSSFQSQYKADITFSLHKADQFSSFCLFSIKYVPHLIFSIDIASPSMVLTSFILLKRSLTASFLNRVVATVFHTFELLLCWSVFLILHNPHSIPFSFIYVKYQIPVHSHFGSSGSKTFLDRVYFSLAFFLKLVNLFLYILNGSTDSNYEFGVLQCHDNSFYFLSKISFLIFFAFAISIKRCITFFYWVKF